MGEFQDEEKYWTNAAESEIEDEFEDEDEDEEIEDEGEELWPRCEN